MFEPRHPFTGGERLVGVYWETVLNVEGEEEKHDPNSLDPVQNQGQNQSRCDEM